MTGGRARREGAGSKCYRYQKHRMRERENLKVCLCDVFSSAVSQRSVHTNILHLLDVYLIGWLCGETWFEEHAVEEELGLGREVLSSWSN